MSFLLQTPIHRCTTPNYQCCVLRARQLFSAHRRQRTFSTNPTTNNATNNSTTTATNNTTTHRHVHESILPQIHPQHLYQIINDVNQYRHFLPFCLESKILQTSQCGTMMDAVLRVGLPGLSALPIGPFSSSSSSMLEERYISRVRMIDAKKNNVLPNNNDGPGQAVWIVEAKSIQSQLFHSLKSRWQLTLVGEEDLAKEITNNSNNNKYTNYEKPDARLSSKSQHSCKVQFEVEIQVSNPFISFTLNQVLEDVAKKQVLAFEKRSRDIPFLQGNV